MLLLQSAAIPYRRNELNQLEVLLITSRRKGRWVLPKGRIKRLMKPHVSAAHEAFEEAGVLGLVSRSAIGSYRQRKSSGGTPREIIVEAYPMLVNTQLRWWPEQRARERRWMTIDDAATAIRNPELRQLLLSFATAAAEWEPVD